MIEWFNKHDPGLIRVRCKTNYFGMQKQIICCELSPIIWRVGIMERNYCPIQLKKGPVLVKLLA